VNTSTRRTLIGALLLAATLLAALWLAGASGGARAVVRPTPLKPPPTAEPLVPTPLPEYRATALPRTSEAPTATDRPTAVVMPLVIQPSASSESPTVQATTFSRASETPAVEDRPAATSTPRGVQPMVSSAAPTVRATTFPRASETPVAVEQLAATSTPRGDQPQASSDRARVGAALPVGPGLGKLTDYVWDGAEPGWYLSWNVDPRPVPGARFAQMVRVREDGFSPASETIRLAAQANPGSLWLIGNEPDVKWQDNVTPERYAAVYGELHAAIKAADPTAQVAIGGVSQPTPLRMAYLDRVLDAYRAQFGTEMPVDVWNIHAFILREERDSWGVDIPPGMDVAQGKLYEIVDHNNMAIFRQQIIDFRRWMAQHGLRDRPLIITEYGILMPASYGFPPDVVSDFLVSTFDYYLTARDPELGYPADDNRLVQAFMWFSTAYNVYPTSNLFDPETHKVTPVGETFKAYVSGLH
jgi:hypothetical protein